MVIGDIEYAVDHLEHLESQMRENREMCLAQVEANVGLLAQLLRARMDIERERRIVLSVHDRSDLL